MSAQADEVEVTDEHPDRSILAYEAIVKQLATEQDLPEAKVRKIVRALVDQIKDGLKAGQSVRIGGLGVIRIRDAGDASTRRVILSPAKTLLEP